MRICENVTTNSDEPVGMICKRPNDWNHRNTPSKALWFL